VGRELTARAEEDERCEHLAAAPVAIRPKTPEGCEGCIRGGTRWVHLRMCLTCGHVGCCDSSEKRHADEHFATSRHPVVRSFEPSEAWRWCYLDQQLG
jgi:CPA1 family monovalent cation:H+ antiporter